MEAARSIRDAVHAVEALRKGAAADPLLLAALIDVKRLQSRRFAGTYADLLRGGPYAAGARFFLEELYGTKDYAERDAQFSRIAGAIERFFPAQVAQTAASLAALHALTEDLDLQLASAWLLQSGELPHASRYALSWRQLGRPLERRRQLDGVLALGAEMARLTTTPGLRTMLRMMRGPASAAGLGALQQFLESGFDTFKDMTRRPGAVGFFLQTVSERESRLLELLFGSDFVASETELARTLGQVP